MYMMDNEDSYYMFKLKAKEFSVDVDVSNLPCGINGALYFVEMPADGDKGMGANAAGAKYGTGYCDAQCPHDIKFIKGEANVENWNDKTAMGQAGICCQEFDVWEANKTSTAMTAHPCMIASGSFKCNDPVTCGDAEHRYDGICDKDGCDYNPYRMGVKNFFGEGMEVDTGRPFSVVTQFLTEDGSENSDVIEIKRFFVQDGKHIPFPESRVEGLSKQVDSLTDDMCDDVKGLFGDKNDFKKKGGMKKQSDALGRGVVLVMSLWDDHAANMLWLDSTYPTDSTKVGAARGPCSTSSGNPDDVENQSPNSYVKYSNIKYGDIGTTNPAEAYMFL